MVEELPFEACRNTCGDLPFRCDSTDELPPLKEIIGQERAVNSLQFGLKILNKGYNIYISGVPGTGRRTAVTDYIGQLAKLRDTPPDWCYVFNFDDPNQPNALRLPSGRGREFQRDMERFVGEIRKDLTEAFTSDEYGERRTQVLSTIEEERNQLLKKINDKTLQEGFSLQRTPIGLILTPIIQGRPINDQEFSQLPERLQREIRQKREKLQRELRDFFRMLRDIQSKADEVVQGLNRDVAEFALDPVIESLKIKFQGCEEVVKHLDAVNNDVISNLDTLLVDPQQQQSLPFPLPTRREDPLLRYRVNLIVDNSDLEGAPVVLEPNPTYSRLFGAMEKEAQFGTLITNYTMIRAGSAHKANGGFLVVPIEGLLTNALVWDSLKRTIENEQIEIEEPASRLGFMVTKTMQPEPIPFNTKIVILGDPLIYNLLYARDVDFKELFKVKVDFDTVMERNEENINQYGSFICTLCNKEGLNHLDPSAIASVIDYSSRVADNQNKLSTQFARVADLIREANFYSKEGQSDVITRDHINKALEEKIHRSNMIQEKIQEMISKGTIIIDTEGENVGQVNGLAVLSLGDYSFGKPSKITASIGVGNEGIIDIEREAEMGGPTHTKGVLILSGYLNNAYAQDKPLSLTARLVFEQSYSGVDGDSASSTELYTMLSALSEVPIKQYIAVTGSVNQMGAVQAIGGVNQKIEGFFEVCKAKGLNGKQGCLIPHSNVQNLMLKEEVVEAVKEGRFHIWPAKTINEGIEVLTGIKAGERKEDGTYEEGTINYLVQKKLDEMAKSLARARKEE